MREMSIVRLDSFPELAEIKKMINEADKKFRNWLLYVVLFLLVISYITFINFDFGMFTSANFTIFFLLLIASMILVVQKFEHVMARNSILRPRSDFEKYCILICQYAKIVNGQITEFNTLFSNLREDPHGTDIKDHYHSDKLEVATILAEKKRFLENILSNLGKEKSNPTTLLVAIAIIAERIKKEK
ncbi:MAG: hypothetical protein WC663_01605 [Patescibacteria group bacterium]|jgi:hypothetical protein